MRRLLQPFSISLSLLLIACSSVAAQKNPYDLYDLRPAGADNDSYYTPPKGHSNCMTIGDLPSCTDF